MIKVFCDICGKETTQDVCDRRISGDLEFINKEHVCYEIRFGNDFDFDDGDICPDCLMETINKTLFDK